MALHMTGEKWEMKLLEAIRDALDIILKKDPTASKWSNWDKGSGEYRRL